MNDPASDPGSGTGEDPDRGLDIDAAFADIVANFGELSTEPDALVEPVETDAEDPAPPTQAPDSLREMFAPMWQPDPNAAVEPVETPDETEHFVPPEPPPLPHLDPGRKAAWIALFGAPLAALVLLVLQVAIPPLLGFGLGLAFVGGFGYLVATMGNGPEDPYAGDDGAVI